MELYQLRHFVAVAETGSFTRAAERCYVTQPALSGSIARLEEDLGTKLFERTKRSVALTDAGRLLLNDSVSILKACSQLKADIRGSSATKRLRLGLVTTFPTHKIASLLTALRADLAGLDIEIAEGNTAELDEKLAANKLDVALTIINNKPAEAVMQMPIYQERYMLFAAVGHPFANKKELRLEDLTAQNFIVRTSCEGYLATSALFREQKVRTKVVCKTQHDDRALELVRSGIGIALLPELFDAPGVTKIPIIDLKKHRTLGLKWPKQNQSDVIDRLCVFAKTHPWI